MIGTRLRLGPHHGRAVVIADGNRFVVAAYVQEGEAERLELYAVTDAGAISLGRAAIDPPLTRRRRRVRPALAIRAGQAVVLYSDGRSRLWALQTPLFAGTTLRPVQIGDHVGQRSPPVLALNGAELVAAYTEAETTPTRVLTMRLDARLRVASRARISPSAAGASSPTWLPGEPTTLLTLDSRRALSNLFQTRFAAGRPGAPAVARPLSLVYGPPSLSAVRMGNQGYLAYTAVGEIAMTKVALASLADNSDPRLLFAPRGYGALTIDGTSDGSAAYFVAESPMRRGRNAPREVLLRRVRGQEMTAPLRLVTGSRRANAPSIAWRRDGALGVTLGAPDGLFLFFVRCGETPDAGTPTAEH